MGILRGHWARERERETERERERSSLRQRESCFNWFQRERVVLTGVREREREKEREREGINCEREEYNASRIITPGNKEQIKRWEMTTLQRVCKEEGAHKRQKQQQTQIQQRGAIRDQQRTM